MKASLFIYFLLLTTIRLPAQSRFDQQIRVIVKDTINGFKNLRGAVEDDQFVYGPKVRLDSADKTRIFDVATRSYYVFEVVNSRTPDSILAEQTLLRWKQKISAALGPAFVISPARAPIGLKKYFDKGYVFNHGKLFITLEQMNDIENAKRIHYLRVYIMYKPGI